MHLVWDEMSEKQQDNFPAEWLLDAFESEDGKGRAACGWALSAVQKVNPRSSFKTAWKLYDAWGCRVPPRQAPAAPPELLISMFVVALLLC